MLGSHGLQSKQHLWDESILVSLLLRYPEPFDREGKKMQFSITVPDLMPTLLGLCQRLFHL